MAGVQRLPARSFLTKKAPLDAACHLMEQFNVHAQASRFRPIICKSVLGRKGSDRESGTMPTPIPIIAMPDCAAISHAERNMVHALAAFVQQLLKRIAALSAALPYDLD